MNTHIMKLRFWAILAVIMIHSTAPFLYKPIGNEFLAGNVLDSLSRFAVPLFLLISGALLLHKDEPLSVFLKKRAAKIIIPFLVWSFIYYLYKRNILFTLDFEKFHIRDFLKLFITGNVYYHLWYIYLIVFVYLFIPVLRKVVQNTPTNILLYYVILSFILENGYLIGTSYLHISPKIYFSGFSGYVSYLILGYLIFHRDLFLNKRGMIYTLGILSLIVTFTGTYLSSLSFGRYHPYFYKYLSFNVLIYTIFIVVLISHTNKNIFKITRSISEVSFTMYFVHIIFSKYFQQYLNAFDLQPSLYIIALFGLTVIASYLFSLLISKIPIVRKVLS